MSATLSPAATPAATATRFSFRDRPGHLSVLFAGESIIEFINEHVYFRTFRIDNVRLRPGGPVELVGLLTSAIYPATALLACAWETRHVSPDCVEVVLTPSKLEGELGRLVTERRVYRITHLPALGRFRFDLRVELDFHADIRGNEGLHHTPMEQWPGDDFAVIEFDDPLLSGGVGPQVPMSQDWVGMYEPVLHPHTFSTDWHKRYLSAILDTKLRGPRNLAFNRVVNGVQRFYNRTLPVTRPGSPFLYPRIDGRFLRMTPRFEFPASHHICEWGYDMHFYALLPKAGNGLIFRAGQRVRLDYSYDEIDRAEAPAEMLSAPPAEIEPAERLAADRPIYEEPACRFTGSALDHPDSYAWDAEGDAHWDRAGGHEPGTGALAFRHGNGSRSSAWRFNHWGPSYACNPVPPMSRLELSAWVRADEIEKLRMSFRFDGFAGPSPFSARTAHPFNDAARQVVEQKNGWTRIAFIAGPSPSLTLCGEVRIVYQGRGDAAVSGLSIRRL